MPDSRQLPLLGTHMRTPGAPFLWLLDVESREVTQQWSFPGYFISFMFSMGDGVRSIPMWAPDGRRVFLERLGRKDDTWVRNGFLFDVDTGELTPLYEGDEARGVIRFPLQGE